jgi:hypothetical protein
MLLWKLGCSILKQDPDTPQLGLYVFLFLCGIDITSVLRCCRCGIYASAKEPKERVGSDSCQIQQSSWKCIWRLKTPKLHMTLKGLPFPQILLTK